MTHSDVEKMTVASLVRMLSLAAVVALFVRMWSLAAVVALWVRKMGLAAVVVSLRHTLSLAALAAEAAMAASDWLPAACKSDHFEPGLSTSMSTVCS
jgi:hypothetical protein